MPLSKTKDFWMDYTQNNLGKNGSNVHFSSKCDTDALYHLGDIFWSKSFYIECNDILLNLNFNERAFAHEN